MGNMGLALMGLFGTMQRVRNMPPSQCIEVTQKVLRGFARGNDPTTVGIRRCMVQYQAEAIVRKDRQELK